MKSCSRVPHCHPNQLKRSLVEFNLATTNQDNVQDWLILPPQTKMPLQLQAEEVEQPIVRKSSRVRQSLETLIILGFIELFGFFYLKRGSFRLWVKHFIIKLFTRTIYMR